MDAREIIKAVVSDSGYSQRQISLSIGRKQHYIASYISKERVPSIELMAEISDACGCDLIVRNRNNGNEYIIDPPNDRLLE